MKLDVRDYPTGHILSEVVAEELGIYVHVAQFNDQDYSRTFRLIVDSDISREAIQGLMTSSVRDRTGVYTFSHIEAISGPIVDKGPRPSQITNYLRITFM